MSGGNGFSSTKPQTNYTHYINDVGDIPIFDRRTVITVQPFASEEISQRTPLPIPTISSVLQSNIPFNGVRQLFDISEVTIEQTYELHDLLTIIQSENRYFIKSAGEILFGGIEESLPVQRLCCMSNRKFVFRLFDRSRQEAFFFKRRLACVSPFGCWLQRIEVFIPHGNYLGCVQQKWDPFETKLHVNDSENNLIYLIIGPTQCICPIFRESSFNVFDTNFEQIAKIGHEWDTDIMNYKLTVRFPGRANTTHKALLIACGILVEYMFFEAISSGGCCQCIICHK